MTLPYYSKEVIKKAKEMDLLTYLQNYEPDELVHFSGDTYCTKEHDSLKISNGLWCWNSRGIGGKSAVKYLTDVKGYSFIDAVKIIVEKEKIQPHVKAIAPKKKRVYNLKLPPKSPTDDKVKEYLTGRGINESIIDYCLEHNLIFESLPYHNAVFVGFNEQSKPKYAAFRATENKRIMGECEGSDKSYSFKLTNDNSNIHLFESAIDLLSYATLVKMQGKDWQNVSMISLAGVYMPKEKIEESKIPKALVTYLKSHPYIEKIYLHLDSDYAGRLATKTLKIILSTEYSNIEIVDNPVPRGKDVNDFLLLSKGMKGEYQVNEENLIKVLLVEPFNKPKIITIENNYQAISEIICGDADEYMPFEDDVFLLCNADGKRLSLSASHTVTDTETGKTELIYGSFILIGAGEFDDEYHSLDDDLIDKYIDLFSK